MQSRTRKRGNAELAIYQRHQPVGKIHLGLVWKSHQAQMRAAMMSKPKTWLRRASWRCRSRASCSACCSRCGLMRRDMAIGSITLHQVYGVDPLRSSKARAYQQDCYLDFGQVGQFLRPLRGLGAVIGTFSPGLRQGLPSFAR
jgi:hypothetical protein